MPLGDKKRKSFSGEAWGAAKLQADLAKKKKGAEAEALAEVIETRNANLDKILEAYEKANDDHKFMKYMLEASDMLLTKESLKKNPTIEQYLKSKLKEQALTPKYYEGFVRALPSEQDYIDKAHGGEVEETAKPKKTKAIRAKKSKEPSEETAVELAGMQELSRQKKAEELEEVRGKIAGTEESPSSKVEVDQDYANEIQREAAQRYNQTVQAFESDQRQSAKESRAEEAQRAYVKAYREYDPGFTTNKADDLVAVTRPPFLAFGKAAKELKRLNGLMVQAREKMASEDEKIQETLGENKRKPKISEGGLKSETREALAESNEVDELVETLKNRPTSVDTEMFLKKQENYNLGQDVIKADRIRYDLLQAYKEMGVLVGEGKGGNTEELLGKKPPFSYRFSERGRKVRDLYDKYVKKLKEEE